MTSHRTAAPISGRFIELDGLRGVAALAVVIYHFTSSYDSIYEAPPSPFVAWWGMFGVQLFFMISGYVILMSASRADRVSDFVISRVARLYPPYWLAVILSSAVAIATQMPDHPMAGWQRVVNALMFQRWLGVPNVDDVYWTLALELQFYVLVACVLWATRCRLTARRVALCTGIWVAIALATTCALFPQTHGINPQHVRTPIKVILNMVLAEWAPLFATGIFAYLARSTRNGRYRWASLVTGIVAIVSAGLLNNFERYAAAVAVCVAAFLVVTWREKTPFLRTPPLQWLGRMSYPLYICHGVAGTAVMHAVLPLVGRVPAMVIAVAFSLALSWILHEVGEVRLSRWLKSRLVRVRSAWGTAGR